MEIDNQRKMISKEILLEIGKKKGLTNKEHIEKIYFQDIFLFNLFKKTNKFIFKGGTALYKFYNLPRFSEDLDFSIIKGLNYKEIEDIIKDLLKNTSYFYIKDIKKTSNSILIRVSCKGILTNYNTLRIDINFKNKVLDGFDIKNYISDYIDINPFSLRVLKPQEIISEKIHSLLNREKARDLFDLFFLLRQFEIDNKLIKEKLKIFNMDYNKDTLKKNINKLKEVWEKELRAFVLIELPEFNLVRDYVFQKMKIR